MRRTMVQLDLRVRERKLGGTVVLSGVASVTRRDRSVFRWTVEATNLEIVDFWYVTAHPEDAQWPLVELSGGREVLDWLAETVAAYRPE
jgi:hypothetical protein